MRIVPPFDVAEERESGFGMRGKAMSREALDFEGGEEAFSHGVIVGIATCAHRWPDAEEFTSLPKRKRAILRSLIRVMDHVRRATLRLSGHLKSGH